MDNAKSMIDKFFEARSEYISYISDDEQKIIESLKKNLEIKDFVSDATEEQLLGFESFLDEYTDNLNSEMAYLTERSYKLGVEEGITFIIECLMARKF